MGLVEQGTIPRLLAGSGFFIYGEIMNRYNAVVLVMFVLVSVAYAGEEDRDASTPYTKLDSIVVTPSRYVESDVDVSKNVTIIDSGEIEKNYVRYVPDLLESKPGIEVRDFLGNGKTAQVDIRGFGDTSVSNTLVLIDGRRTNQIDISGPDWAQINVGSIDRIEITRGGQSVLYGDNASAGVINIITKSGSGKKPAIGLEYNSGSYRYNSGSAYIEGGAKFLDYYGRASWSYNGGYRTNNHLETSDYNGKITLKPTDIVKIGLEGGYHNDWYGMPGSLQQADFDVVGWRGSIYPNDMAKTEDAYFMASPEAKFEFGSNEVLSSCDISARSRRTAFLNFNPNGTNGEQNNHIRTMGAVAKIAFTSDFSNIYNRLILGLDYYGNRDDTSSTHYSTNDFWATYFMNGRDCLTIQKDTLGLYATDTIELFNRLILNGGYRAEQANYKFEQISMIAGKSTQRAFEFAADAGIDYKYNDRSSVYANYSRSFRFPAVDEWYMAQFFDVFSGTIQGGLNADLVPQTGNNYEIGIKENSSKYVRAKVDYFLMDIKHELFYDPIIFVNAVYDHTMRHGLELEAHVYPVESLDCIANYTYEKAFYIGSHFAGHEIPMVPYHKLSAGIDYTFMDCVDFTYLANAVGLQRFINDQQNLSPRMKPYVTHDIKLSYHKYGVEIYGAIYNILDEKYSAYAVTNGTGTAQAYYPSPGVNYVTGIKYRF